MLVLYAWSTMTWYGLVTIDRGIERLSDSLSRLVYGEPLPTEALDSLLDLSRLEISTNPSLLIMVTTPNGNRVGQLNEDVVLREVPSANVSLLQIRQEAAGRAEPIETKQWLLEATPVENGHYQISISSIESGRFVLELRVVDKANFYSRKFSIPIEIAPGTILTYQLDYHKEAVRRSSLYQKSRWRDLL